MVLSQEIAQELAATAARVSCRGKGILAADESTGTIGKRFAKISKLCDHNDAGVSSAIVVSYEYRSVFCVVVSGVDVESTPENRTAYRELLFTSEGLGQYISGVILFEETLFSKTANGTSMVALLEKEGVVPGIKMDKGLAPLAGTDEEHATQGLDGLDERCAKYYEAGARFAKWRAVVTIDQAKGKPSDLAIKETAHTLARYAAICQRNRLVPIVEPEILADGDHSIEVCADVTERVLSEVFKELQNHKILLEGCLLKPNMVTPGVNNKSANHPTSHEAIGFYTLRTLQRTVPPALVGIHFLSGGQSEEDATLNLNAMNTLTTLRPSPWVVSFSYGRALQASCLEAWKGKKENVAAAQKALLARAKVNAQAQLGKYVASEDAKTEGGAACRSLYEKRYVY